MADRLVEALRLSRDACRSITFSYLDAEPLLLRLEAAEQMAEALEAAEAVWRRAGEGHSAHFERMAEKFYAETGFIAPGRSVPLEMGGYNEDERQAAWVAFFEKPYKLLVAALAQWREASGGEPKPGEQ